MIEKLAFLLILTIASHWNFAQSIEELYTERKFEQLKSYEDQADELGTDELYYVGYAFFESGDDKKAIKMYDIAIEKGLDEGFIYYYKGLAHRYDGEHEKAVRSFKMAIEREPKRQRNFNELANAFYFRKEYDSALVYFYQARSLDYELGDPYLKIPNIYHIQENFEQALQEYQISASMIDNEVPEYREILMSIGQLQYTVFERFEKAAEAYSEVISLEPENYDVYPKLIKAYYANEQYAQGDSLFFIMKAQYEKGQLSEEYQRYGCVSMDQFNWNGRIVTSYRYFKEATDPLDITYKVFLLSEDGQSIERRMMTERTLPLGDDSAIHLLCERENSGVHHTYSYGWSTEEIPYPSLKKAVLMAFDGKLTPSASSNFGGSSTKKKRKRK